MNKISVESRIVQSSSFIIFFPPLWLCDGINYLFFLWAQSVIPIKTRMRKSLLLSLDKKKCLGIKCVEHYPSDNNKDFLILVFIGITDWAQRKNK